MVQAAATLAKAATTTATVGSVEGLSATINVATAVPKTVETTIQMANVATEVTSGGLKTVEVGTKAAEVAATSDALSAATTIDTTLKTGAAAPEAAMENLVATPAAKVEIAEQVVSDATIDAQWADQKHTEILHSVQPQITEWEKANPPGDDIPGWIERRMAAEKQFTVNEAVSRDVGEWKSRNQELEKTDHEKWEKNLATKTAESRQLNEASYDQFLAQQQEKNQGIRHEEFMRLYAELLKKRAQADFLAMRLNNLRASPHQTAWRKDVLTRAENNLTSLRGDIQTLELYLQSDAAKSGSALKQWIIPAAVGVSMAAGAMAGPANEI